MFHAAGAGQNAAFPFVEEKWPGATTTSPWSSGGRGSLPGSRRRLAPHGEGHEFCARLQNPEPGPEYRTRVATIPHRCLYYTGMVILEHYRAAANSRRGLARSPRILRNLRGMGRRHDAGGGRSRRGAQGHPLYGHLRDAAADRIGQPLQPPFATSTSSGAGPASGLRWFPSYASEDSHHVPSYVLER